MVEEKDAELEENKRKEMEAVSSRTSLELELSKHKMENISMKQQMKIEMTQKETLQKELNDLKKEMSYMKITQLAETRNQVKNKCVSENETQLMNMFVKSCTSLTDFNLSVTSI